MSEISFPDESNINVGSLVGVGLRFLPGEVMAVGVSKSNCLG